MESPPNPTNQPPVLQVVLRKPYSEIKAFSEWLKANTLNYLIGEHPAAKSNGIHCHILIEGLKVTREALRKQVNKYSPGQGQNFTSALTQEPPRVPYDRDILAKYIFKGHIEYHMSSTFSPEYIAARVSEWIFITRPTVTVIQAKPAKKVNTIYEDCSEILDEYFPNGFPTSSMTDRREVVRATITWANEKKKAMNAYKHADYYDCIMMKAVPEYYSTLVCDIINNRHKKS